MSDPVLEFGLKEKFKYRRIIHFYEADPMNIVHHGRYLLFCEEARVAWAIEKGIITANDVRAASMLAVISTEVQHLRPLKFNDQIEVYLQVHRERLRIFIDYLVYNPSKQEVSAKCKTVHVGLDENLRLTKYPQNILDIIEREVWTETWPWNL